MNFYKGNFNQDRENEFKTKKGWLVGHFMEYYRNTNKMCVKFWKFNKGEEKDHQLKYEKEAVECTIILKGKVQGVIDGKELIFQAGEYVVIPAKIRSNMIVKVLEEPVEGFTIKSPSIEGDSIKMGVHV